MQSTATARRNPGRFSCRCVTCWYPIGYHGVEGICPGGLLSNRCCICDKALTGTSWVCHTCAATYGLEVPYRQWPDWARALVSFENRERRYQRTIGAITVSYEEAGVENLVYGEMNDDPLD